MPFVTHLDEVMEYIRERRELYDKGYIPKEDIALRGMVVQILQFIKDVNNDFKYEKSNVGF